MCISAFAQSESLVLHTVAQPPYIYEPYRENQGALMEATKLAFEDAKIDYTVVYHTEWDEAFNELNTRSNAVYVADITNINRDVMYGSVNTGFIVTNAIYARTDSYFHYDGIESLKGMKIGIVSDRLTGDKEFDKKFMLNKYDFRQKNDVEHLLMSLYMGWVDVAILPQELAEHSLRMRFGKTQYKIEQRGQLNKEYLRLIFNNKISKETIRKIQKSYDEVRKGIRIYW